MDSYDRRAAGTPVNRIRESEQTLRAANREVERSLSTISGVYSELLTMARHTHDKAVKQNFDYVQELYERTEKMHKDLKTLADAYDEAAREYR